MKKCLLLATVILMITSATVFSGGAGSGFGSFDEAGTIGNGRGNILGGIGMAGATSIFGQFTYGLSQYTDGRIKLGFVDDKDVETRVMFGADVKYNFLTHDSSGRIPFDMAAGGFIEYYDLIGGSVWMFGGSFTGSFPFTLNNNNRLVPYGRVDIRLERFNSDFGDNSDIQFGLNLGLKWEATDLMHFYGELKLDGNDGIFLGLDIGVL